MVCAHGDRGSVHHGKAKHSWTVPPLLPDIGATTFERNLRLELLRQTKMKPLANEAACLFAKDTRMDKGARRASNDKPAMRTEQALCFGQTALQVAHCMIGVRRAVDDAVEEARLGELFQVGTGGGIGYTEVFLLG